MVDEFHTVNAKFKTQDTFNKAMRSLQRMVRYITSLRSRIKKYKNFLYDNAGPPKYYEELAWLQAELYECRIQQRENISHVQILEQKLHDLENEASYCLEIQSPHDEPECVKHEFVDTQSKVCDNSNLDLALDLDCTYGQHEENEIVSHEIVCSEDVVEQLEFSDCSSQELLDNMTIEDIHALEQLPFVPSALHVQDVEFSGDIVAEIEPETPPITCSILLDFDDPMLRLSRPFIYIDLRANPLEEGGDDTIIMGTLGAGRESEDHHEASKG